jgi:FkbM family methyltransferase
MPVIAEALKWVTARLPGRWQLELRRVHYRRAIRRGRFTPDEPENALLDSFVSPGDWVIDVGANIGHYSKRLSELVGPAGRVLAIEPVPETFSILADNALHFPYANLSLLNFAASDVFGVTGVSIPRLRSGLRNYYMASIDREADALQVMTLPLDSLLLEKRISLVKIDVEGHEMKVLVGMAVMLERDHPALIVETHSREVELMLEHIGYSVSRLPRSPNVIAKPPPFGRSPAGVDRSQ